MNAAAADLLITNLAEVATPHGSTPRRGSEQGEVVRLRGAEVLCRDGRIAFVGAPEERRARFGELADAERLDGRGGTLIPGFVDPHTHLPWAGTREEEFVARLAGTQLSGDRGGRRRHPLDRARHARGLRGGARRSCCAAGSTACSPWGTTTAEAKSGYGLSLDDELKQLRAIAPRRRRATRSTSCRRSSPRTRCRPSTATERERYLDLICEEIVPPTAEQGLARFCDVFCERGVFSAEESRRVLEAGAAPRPAAAPPRRRVRRLGRRRARRRARRVLRRPSHGGLATRASTRLPRSGVTAVLLPGTSFFLMKKQLRPGPPARRGRRAGALWPPTATPARRTPSRCRWSSCSPCFELGLTIEESADRGDPERGLLAGPGRRDRLGRRRQARRPRAARRAERPPPRLPLRDQPGGGGGQGTAGWCTGPAAGVKHRDRFATLAMTRNPSIATARSCDRSDLDL